MMIPIQSVNLLLLTDLLVNGITASNTSLLMKTNKADKLMTGYLRRTKALASTFQGRVAASPLPNVEEDGLLHEHDDTANARQLSASTGVYVNGIVRLYRGQGNLNDDVAGQNLAPQSGSTVITFSTETLRTGYPPRQVLYFNQTGRAVGPAVGLSAGSAPRTIVGWFKRDGTTGGNGPFGYGAPVCNKAYFAYFPGGQSTLELDQWCQNEGVNPVISNMQGIWYHVAFSWDGSKNTAFVNGVQVRQGTPDTTPDTVVNGSHSRVAIGGNVTETIDSSSLFRGHVADFAIFDRALTVSEISSIYQNPTGLVACTSGSHCASGYCANNICTSGQFGASCDPGENGDCASGNCDPGVNTCASQPSKIPSLQPSKIPSLQPSKTPSQHPSEKPSRAPSLKPSFLPSKQPTLKPSVLPSTHQPSLKPSDLSTPPSNVPTFMMTQYPSKSSNITSTLAPSNSTSTPQPIASSLTNSNSPVIFQSKNPSLHPSLDPSVVPLESSSFLPSATSLVETSTTLYFALSGSYNELNNISEEVFQSISSSLEQYLIKNIPLVDATVELAVYETGIVSNSLTNDAFSLRRLSSNEAAIRLVAYIQSISRPSGNDVSSAINDSIRNNTLELMNVLKSSAAGSLSSLTGYIASLEDIHPSTSPSSEPSYTPSSEPSYTPSSEPSYTPSSEPSYTPSSKPSFASSTTLSLMPTVSPSLPPSYDPSSRFVDEGHNNITRLPTSTSVPSSETSQGHNFPSKNNDLRIPTINPVSMANPTVDEKMDEPQSLILVRLSQVAAISAAAGAAAASASASSASAAGAGSSSAANTASVAAASSNATRQEVEMGIIDNNTTEDEHSLSREQSARQSNNRNSAIDRAATVVNRIRHVVDNDNDSKSGEINPEISSTEQHETHSSNHVELSDTSDKVSDTRSLATAANTKINHAPNATDQQRDRVKSEHNGIGKSNVVKSTGIVECEQSGNNSSSQGTTNDANSFDQLAEYYRNDSPSLSIDPRHDAVLPAKSMNDNIQYHSNSIEQSESSGNVGKNDSASKGIFFFSKKDQRVEEKYARVEGGTATLSNNRTASKKMKKKGQAQIESEQVVYSEEAGEFANERIEDKYDRVEGGTATLCNFRTADKVNIKINPKQVGNDKEVEKVPEMMLADKLTIAEGALEDGFDTSFSEKYVDNKRTIKKFMKHSMLEKSGNSNNLETIDDNEREGRLKFLRRKNDDDEVLEVYFHVAIGIRKLLTNDDKVESDYKEGVLVVGDSRKDGSLKKTSKLRHYLKRIFGRKLIVWEDNLASGAAEELADEENQLKSKL